jgi:hypothetical protein
MSPQICGLERLGRVLRQTFTSSPGEALTGERPGELGAGSGDSDLLPFTGEPALLIAKPTDGHLQAKAVSQSRTDRCQVLANGADRTRFKMGKERAKAAIPPQS